MEKRFAGSAYRYFLIWSICASLAITVCTIVDALLVGNLVGSDGLAVANLSTPVFLLYALFGITIGVGANVNIGRLLGAGEVAAANRVFHAQLGFGLLVGAACLAPLAFKRAYFTFLGVTAELYPLAERYLTVVMWSAPVFVVYHILSVSVRTDSDPRRSAAASAVVIVTNLTLDLLFMQVLGWGILGASASLCIAEALGVAVLLTHFLKRDGLLTLRTALPTRGEMGEFLAGGFGMGSANIFGAAVMLVFNTLLLRVGGSAGALMVALYGVIYTIGTIPSGVFDGAANALATVTAFFTGEADIDGIFTVLKRALAAAVAGGSALALLCALFPEALLWLFGLRDGMDGAASAMRLYAASLVPMGINTVATAFWQSTGRARLAGAMSVVRNCLLLLALGTVLIPRGGIVGLAAAYFLTELLCALAAVVLERRSPSRQYATARYGLAGRSFEKSYRIRTESMEEISGDLERVCDEWALDMKQSFLVSFICEELLLNIIKFGLSDTDKRRDYYVSIKLMEREDGCALRIRDNVSLYDPFAADGDEIDAGVLRLIQKKTKYCDYQRKMIFNYFYTII